MKSIMIGLYVIFLSSRRRHRRCALVTGVQTCALPILLAREPRAPLQQVGDVVEMDRQVGMAGPDRGRIGLAEAEEALHQLLAHQVARHLAVELMSDERRVGKEYGSTCRSR